MILSVKFHDFWCQNELFFNPSDFRFRKVPNAGHQNNTFLWGKLGHFGSIFIAPKRGYFVGFGWFVEDQSDFPKWFKQTKIEYFCDKISLNVGSKFGTNWTQFLIQIGGPRRAP